MLKGAQKQMIVVRTGDSRYFDEAYFVLRREIKAKRSGRNEFLREANRIIEESGIRMRESVCARPKGTRIRGWMLFLAGLICGGGTVLALLLAL